MNVQLSDIPLLCKEAQFNSGSLSSSKVTNNVTLATVVSGPDLGDQLSLVSMAESHTQMLQEEGPPNH